MLNSVACASPCDPGCRAILVDVIRPESRHRYAVVPSPNKRLDVGGGEAVALAQLTIFEACGVRQDRSFGLRCCQFAELHAQD
jgi:hypothetical protein